MNSDKKPYKLLLVDDEQAWSNNLRDELERLNFEVCYEEKAENTLNRIRKEKPDAVLLDILFNQVNKGKSTLDQIKKKHKSLPVIMLTSTMVDTYVDADYPGRAFAYPKDALKPEKIETYEAFAGKIRGAIEGADDIENYIERFKELGLIVGNTEAMREVCRMVLKAKETDSPVLITGESGTGKEMIAKAIHQLSGRKDNRLISVPCGAITDTLVESELFGVCAEAATQVTEKEGYFEQAVGGTIFLDEIGTMKIEHQAKLLRALQEKKIARVGSKQNCKCKNKRHTDHTEIEIDTRVIAATNTDITQAIKVGKFREDLYYRLNVIHIEMPLLRKRLEDIEILYKHFVNKLKTRLHREEVIDNLRPQVKEMFVHYEWPGNIRELELAIERAMNSANSAILMEGDFSLRGSPESNENNFGNTDNIVQDIWVGKTTWKDLKDEFNKKGTRRTLILKGLVDRWVSERKVRPEHKDLAKLLKINPRNMQKKFEECGLKLTEDWPKRLE
jgi:DNA-binding NtrC family response regulator